MSRIMPQPKWQSNRDHDRYVSKRRTTRLRRLLRILQFPRYPIAPPRFRLPTASNAESEPSTTPAALDRYVDRLSKPKSYLQRFLSQIGPANQSGHPVLI